MKLSLDNAIAPIFVLIWSTGFVIARLAMPYVEPATFLFWRFAGVLMAMACLSLVWKISWPSWSQMKRIAVAGVLLQFGYLLGVWFAVRLGMTAGLVAIIVGFQRRENGGKLAGEADVDNRADDLRHPACRARCCCCPYRRL